MYSCRMRTSEEIWQNLEKNATQIMIFLPHYMRAENNKTLKDLSLHTIKTVTLDTANIYVFLEVYISFFYFKACCECEKHLNFHSSFQNTAPLKTKRIFPSPPNREDEGEMNNHLMTVRT